jgi:hypothetical protein
MGSLPPDQGLFGSYNLSEEALARLMEMRMRGCENVREYNRSARDEVGGVIEVYARRWEIVAMDREGGRVLCVFVGAAFT